MKEGGGQSIGQALALNTTLMGLDLHCNSLGQGAGRAIGQALGVTRVLKYLNRSYNIIGTKGARKIGQALSRLLILIPRMHLLWRFKGLSP